MLQKEARRRRRRSRNEPSREFRAVPQTGPLRDHAYTDLSISQSFVLSFLRADIHQSQAVTTLCRLKVDAVVPTCSK